MGPAVRFVGTLALGAAGGYVFLLLKMPLAWMMGAMCVTTAAALAGAPLRRPGKLRETMIAVIGLLVGSNFTPEALARAHLWIPSLFGLLTYTAVAIIALGWGLRRFAGFDPATAFCSTSPGGFAEMILLGNALGGDERVIGLMHTIRIFVTVVTIPLWFRIAHGYVGAGTAAFGSAADLSAPDALVLAVSATVGWLLARWARLPLPALIGPMAICAALHLLGLSTARPPGELVAAAQVVIGAAVGCRFLGTPIRQFLFIVKTAVAMAVTLLAMAVLFAVGVKFATGLPLETLILAYSPGGVAEMNLITVALNIDPAFVAVHHLLRLAFLLLLAPLAIKFFGRRWSTAANPAKRPTDRPPDSTSGD